MSRRLLTLSVLLAVLLLAPLTFAQTVIDLDVKPGSDVNPINVKSHGSTPFALLCSPTFDPATVDVTMVQLGGVAAVHCALEDVNADVCLDLVCHVATPALGVTCATTELTVTATLLDGVTTVTGTDTVTPVPCKKP